jgi:hypothetical protein
MQSNNEILSQPSNDNKHLAVNLCSAIVLAHLDNDDKIYIQDDDNDHKTEETTCKSATAKHDISETYVTAIVPYFTHYGEYKGQLFVITKDKNKVFKVE